MVTKPDPAAEGTIREENPEKWLGLRGECVFRVIVPTIKVRILNRDLSKKISEETKTQTFVGEYPSYDAERCVHIFSEEKKGALLSPAMNALRRIFKCVNGFPENESDGVASISSCSIRLIVLSKQSSSIDRIMKSTGCSYRLLCGSTSDLTYLRSIDSLLDLWGNAPKVLKALEAVGTYLRTPPQMRLPLKRKRVTQIRSPSPSPSSSPPASPSSASSFAMPVPLHPWLQFENPIFQERYFNIYNTCWINQRPLVDDVLQEFGVLDSVEKYLNYAPWGRLFHIDDPEYRILTLEFLSTFKLHNKKKLPSSDPGYITFQLGGLPRSFSLADWAVITNLYTVEESRSQAFQDAITWWPGRGDSYDYWWEHGTGSFDDLERKTSKLKDPIFRILQKALSHTLCAHHLRHDIVSSAELFYLSCMSKPRDCNVALFLARVFSQYSQSRYPRCIVGARFITRIANMLHIDLSDLEVEPYSETWDRHMLEAVGILVPGDGGLVLAPPGLDRSPAPCPSISTSRKHDPSNIPALGFVCPSMPTSQQHGRDPTRIRAPGAACPLMSPSQKHGHDPSHIPAPGVVMSTSQEHGRKPSSSALHTLEVVRVEQAVIRRDQTRMMTTLDGLVKDISEIGRVVGLLAARNQIPTRLIRSPRAGSVSSSNH